MNNLVLMTGRRKELFNHIFGAQFEAARIHTGMAAQEFPFQSEAGVNPLSLRHLQGTDYSPAGVISYV